MGEGQLGEEEREK